VEEVGQVLSFSGAYWMAQALCDKSRADMAFLVETLAGSQLAE
jgi:hypothetical protein